MQQSADQGLDRPRPDGEVSLYTAAADQTLLSDAAAELLMANLRNRLANPDASALERKA